MKFVLQTVVISPHQLPLARELMRRLGSDAFRYLYMEELPAERRNMGWCASETATWCRRCEKDDRDLEACEVLLSGVRDIALFERRAQKRLKTFYMSERWFKPVEVGIGDRGLRIGVPGWVRMLVPRYRKMAKRFVQWIQHDPNGRVFAIGPWAKKDMLRLGVPESKIIPWGYFVAPSVQQSNNRTIEQSNNLKVLWVGRMIPLKRIDTIVRAVREVKTKGEGERWSVQLTLVGDGPEKKRLMRFAKGLPISFLPSQPIDKIRAIMRDHDVFVFASNAIDGWGAVVSEALEEGLRVLGTFETGASAAMLDGASLFHTGDFYRLATLLTDCVWQKAAGTLSGQGIGDWSVERAAVRLLELAEGTR